MQGRAVGLFYAQPTGQAMVCIVTEITAKMSSKSRAEDHCDHWSCSAGSREGFLFVCLFVFVFVFVRVCIRVRVCLWKCVCLCVRGEEGGGGGVRETK